MYFRVSITSLLGARSAKTLRNLVWRAELVVEEEVAAVAVATPVVGAAEVRRYRNDCDEFSTTPSFLSFFY